MCLKIILTNNCTILVLMSTLGLNNMNRCMIYRNKNRKNKAQEKNGIFDQIKNAFTKTIFKVTYEIYI